MTEAHNDWHKDQEKWRIVDLGAGKISSSSWSGIKR